VLPQAFSRINQRSWQGAEWTMSRMLNPLDVKDTDDGSLLFRGQQHQEEQRDFPAVSQISHSEDEGHETGIFVYVYFAQHLSYRSLVMAFISLIISVVMPRPST
jgi:hypothetical protein